jgi:hypothetical protein
MCGRSFCKTDSEFENGRSRIDTERRLQAGIRCITRGQSNCGNVDSRRSGTLTAQRFLTSSHGRSKGAGMGDKGGKKDKEKNKQQQVTKHKQEEQTKRDKAPVSRSPQ